MDIKLFYQMGTFTNSEIFQIVKFTNTENLQIVSHLNMTELIIKYIAV